jgi:membrane-associated phospholipid phosphatase
LIHSIRSKVLTKHIPALITMLLVVLMLGTLSPAVASPSAQGTEAQVEPGAGSWTTWVLESGDQFRLEAPPNEVATADEIAQLMEMAGERDDAALNQIAYWNAGPPSYRWNQLGVNTLVAHAAPLAGRDLTLLTVAIYDATVAAWDSKYAYNRARPSEVDPALETVIPNPPSPSYPSEYAVTAGAASTILAWLYPDDAQHYIDLAQEAVNSRLLAGVEYPSDVEAGLELGRQVAELVIEYGIADSTDAVWEDTVPTGDGMWTGENPVTPMAGTWKTWVLTSPDQFRPAPPLAYDSEELAAELEEVVSFERTPVTNAIATFWEFGAGGRRNYWFWTDVTTRLILAADWDDNAPMAARAYALERIANFDAYVACWDAKFTYWAMRPFQLDPEFTSLFNTPNHPSYPSAHSCLSGASADVLASLFPGDAAEVQALAEQAGEARIWAGIHVRSDVEVGLELGHQVAEAVIAHHMTGGSQ